MNAKDSPLVLWSIQWGTEKLALAKHSVRVIVDNNDDRGREKSKHTWEWTRGFRSPELEMVTLLFFSVTISLLSHPDSSHQKPFQSLSTWLNLKTLEFLSMGLDFSAQSPPSMGCCAPPLRQLGVQVQPIAWLRSFNPNRLVERYQYMRRLSS